MESRKVAMIAISSVVAISALAFSAGLGYTAKEIQVANAQATQKVSFDKTTAPIKQVSDGKNGAENTTAGNLQAGSSELQKIADTFGPEKDAQLHNLLTHSVGIVDAYAYGSSEVAGQGDYSFDKFVNKKDVYTYLKNDYSQFKQTFSKELSQIPAKKENQLYANKYVVVVKHNGGQTVYFHEDWAVLDDISNAYKQEINYFDPKNYYKMVVKTDSTVGNHAPSTEATNTLREWNDLLFGGKIQLSDVASSEAN